MASYGVGVLAVVALAVAWVAVQIAWRSVFPEVSDDPDVLAGRMGCRGCGCGEPTAACDSGCGPTEPARRGQGWIVADSAGEEKT